MNKNIDFNVTTNKTKNFWKNIDFDKNEKGENFEECSILVFKSIILAYLAEKVKPYNVNCGYMALILNTISKELYSSILRTNNEYYKVIVINIINYSLGLNGIDTFDFKLNYVINFAVDKFKNTYYNK